jgi:hypothetical protein
MTGVRRVCALFAILIVILILIRFSADYDYRQDYDRDTTRLFFPVEILSQL